MDVSVMSTQSTIWSDNTHSKAKTAFTTNEAGPHWMCIKNIAPDAKDMLQVTLRVLAGPQAKDYSKIAKKVHRYANCRQTELGTIPHTQSAGISSTTKAQE
eukprot:3761147-Amphidinium_carterae.1